MILVDTNVLLDVIKPSESKPDVVDWSRRALRDALKTGAGINQIIYAELFGSWREGAPAPKLPNALTRLALPWEAAAIAGQRHGAYRRAGQGRRPRPLPDFYIGAHCEVENLILLTRDNRRFGAYFPNVVRISPSKRDLKTV